MKTYSAVFVAAALLSAVSAVRADALSDTRTKDKVRPAITYRARAFDLRDVRILEGPFKHAMELDGKYLLSLEPDRLLHTFRLNAGIASNARPLGGWEAPNGELRGHFVGHYLTACAMMYASTGDARFKENAQAVVKGLAEVQAKLGDSGYLSAYPETFFDRVEKRERVWAPYYTLHKIYAGLMDVYDYCDDAQALEVCKKMGDWVANRNGRLTDEQMQNMLGEEHGGMNEALANLYGFTANQRYLEFSIRFNHRRLTDSFARGVDNLDGLHANTQFPKFIGAARQYELTGDESMKKAATFFWETVVHERSYITGGNSDGEVFSPKARLSTAFGQNTTETCNAHNMLKLTRHLFAWEPKAEYADYYERTLFNHILASQHPENGRMTYYLRLRSGSAKDYRGENSFECCVGTGVENHAKYGDSIYFHDGAQTLFVNQFMASELNWKEAGVTLRQETSYPEASSTKISITAGTAGEWTMQVRHPAWATSGFQIRVNGQAVASTSPGSYVPIKRTWKSGDEVEVQAPFSLRAEGFKDNPNRLALMNGPIVLAAPVAGSAGPFPTLVEETPRILAGLKPVPGKPNTFTASAEHFRLAGGAQVEPMTLEPFYKISNQRYMVYFDRLTPAQFEAEQAKMRASAANEAALAARTIDFITPGEPNQPQFERDHNLQGENMASGAHEGKNWRHAPNGWFSWDLKVTPDAQAVVVTYWGSDAGRTFDVLVDGKKVKTEVLQGRHPDAFYDETYPLTREMVEGKQKVTVRFQSVNGSTAGGVFGVRVVKGR